MQPKILISNSGFGEANPEALRSLKKRYTIIENASGERFDKTRFLENVSDVNAIIAGTEKISAKVMNAAPHLALIARVGAGTDSIALDEAATRNISITYTPDAPAKGVPEFTLSLMLNLIKNISISDRALHQGEWVKKMGQSLEHMQIGIIGAGKIGQAVIALLRRLYPECSLVFYDQAVECLDMAKFMPLADLMKTSDLISLHVPLNDQTRHMINAHTLSQMKTSAYLVNTARGQIIDEDALYHVLKHNDLAGAALDVFQEEPYNGQLTELDNCLLTAHMGSASKQVRAIMEHQVAEDVINFFEEQKLLRALSGYDFTQTPKKARTAS